MPEKKSVEYNVVREGSEVVLKADFSGTDMIPSIEDNPTCMSQVIDELAEETAVSKIVFMQRRDYEYDYAQTILLREIANLYKQLTRQRDTFAYQNLGNQPQCAKCYGKWFNDIQNIIFNLLKSDPLGAYVELKRILRRERQVLEQQLSEQCQPCGTKYTTILTYLINLLDQTKLITLAKPYLAGYHLGNREAYRRIFKPLIKPDFMYTKLMAAYPPEGKEIGSYSIGETEITIFQMPDTVQYLYHMMPPEFKLTEDKYELVDTARTIMADHKPTKQEFVDPKRMREVFYHVGSDLIEELAESKGIKLNGKEIDELTKILIRYTVGFGLIEVLLDDENMQDISINSPMGRIPMFIVHAEFGDCVTNIVPTPEESESWASKLRMISGRPLDEANPIMDAELILPNSRSRIAVIAPPLNPEGQAYSFRKHRDKPWTYPLLMKFGSMNALSAGLMSFIIDGTRTILIAGTRSAGKTSLLTAMIVEIMRRYRLITIEDTLEIPADAFRELGYNIQQMKVASSMSRGSSEVPAETGLRTTLRLGDSALIVGEVRSSLRGDQEVLIVHDGITKRIAIENIEKMNLKSVYLPTLTNENKMELKQLTGFVKHPKRKQLVKLTTKTGRSVIVTPDHSVFTHINFKIAAINTDQLKQGDPVIIPSKLTNNFNDVDYINLLDLFSEDYRLENAEIYIRKAIKNIGWKRASKICEITDIYRYLLSTQKTRIPIKSFLKLMKQAKVKYSIEDIRIKKGTSNSISAKFSINENVMRFIGYYLAEGNIDATKIQITNSKPKIIEDINYICEKEFQLKVSSRKIKGYGESVQMHIISKPLRDLLIHLGCGKTSFYKKIPEFSYGLSKKKICALLKGMYSGDGSISSLKNAGNVIRYFSTSRKLVEDVSYALLSIGIVCRIFERETKKVGHKNIFIAEIKQRKYVEQFLRDVGFTQKNPKILKKSFTHSKDDSITFNVAELEKHLKLPRKYRHLRRTRCCSKEYLKRITKEVKCSDEIYEFAHGDFFVDRVKSVEIIDLKKPEHVYDLEVKSTQRFVGGFGGILLHNTEAKSLYEAMRVGAQANVVAGTIHGDSPYGVYDRVVNDIGVPKTSFKATDVIMVANPIKSPDGLHKFKRVTQITEVRKFWENDPMLEGGFTDLMKYDPVKDELIPSDDLINGDSDILKSIGGNVKEWASDWDSLWGNVLLRAKIKQAHLDAALKMKDDDMLEAPFTIRVNDKFHNLSEQVYTEVGSLDSKIIYERWEAWLNRECKKRAIRR